MFLRDNPSRIDSDFKIIEIFLIPRQTSVHFRVSQKIVWTVFTVDFDSQGIFRKNR